MTKIVIRPGGLYSAIAGGTSAIGSMLISVAFWQALIIAVVTGALAALGTIIGAVVAGRIAARAVEPVEERVKHVQGVLGADRRDNDGS